MPDSDKILEVLIKLGVVGQQDVQTATDLLKENVTATLAGGEATKDLGAKTEAAAQSVKLFTTHGSELNQVIGALNRITPGLGLALKAAFDPEIADAASVIIGLIEMFREKTAEARKEEEAAAREYVSSFESRAGALQTVISAINEMADATDRSNQKIDVSKTIATGELEVINAKNEAAKKALKLKEDEELAGAKGDPAKEAEIRRRYEDLNVDADLKAEQDRLDKKKALLKKSQGEFDGLQQAAKDARNAYFRGGITHDAEQKEINDQKKEIEDYLKQAKADGDTYRVAQMEADYQIQLKKAGESDARLDALKKAADEADKKLDANKQTNATLSNQIPFDQQVLGIHQASAGADSASELRIENQKLLAQLRDFQRQANSHGGVSGQDIKEHVAALRELNQILPILIKSALPADAAELRKELAQIRTQLASFTKGAGA